MKTFGATVGTSKAKTHFSELIECVMGGNTITITRNGKPVAELRPVNRHDASRAQSILDRIEKRRSRVKPDPEGWTNRDYIEKGRRY